MYDLHISSCYFLHLTKFSFWIWLTNFKIITCWASDAKPQRWNLRGFTNVWFIYPMLQNVYTGKYLSHQIQISPVRPCDSIWRVTAEVDKCANRAWWVVQDSWGFGGLSAKTQSQTGHRAITCAWSREMGGLEAACIRSRYRTGLRSITSLTHIHRQHTDTQRKQMIRKTWLAGSGSNPSNASH